MARGGVGVAVGLAWMGVLLPTAQGQGTRAGNPETSLPPGIRRLTGFGERASWAPDGTRIAFIGRSFGEAYEVDLRTGQTRLLTGHFRHAGFLRVQYLPSGDYLLIGARTFRDIQTTRDRDQEFWILRADLKSAPVALGQKVNEGVAISRTRMRIAWSNTPGQDPALGPGVSILSVGDIVERDGVLVLENRREVLREDDPDCTLEAQDFRRDDAELVYTCYRNPYADVLGLELDSGRTTAYLRVEQEYNEAEGISPDGAWILVESSRDQGADRQDSRYIDIWKLKLEPGGPGYERMTRFAAYAGYKASNPVVSPDGRRVAFQSARNDEPAGVGHGLFLLDLESR